MSQRYNNLLKSFPLHGVEMTEELFKSLESKNFIKEVDLKKALTELELEYYNPFDRVKSAKIISAKIEKAIIVDQKLGKSIKYFTPNIDNILEKAYGGRVGSPGETRIWGGKTYKKVGTKWEYVGQHSKSYTENKVKVDVKPESIGYVIKNVGPGGQETVAKHEAGVVEGNPYPEGTYDNAKWARDKMEEFLSRPSKPSVFSPKKADLMMNPAYFKDMAGEGVFELGGKRWQYVWADYNGKIDIGVYSLDEDIVYGYDWFQNNYINKSVPEMPV